MSALGHKRRGPTEVADPPMFALPPITTKLMRHNEPSRCAISDRMRCSKTASSLDHLVSTGEQRRRHGEAQRLGVVRLRGHCKLRLQV